MIDVWDQPPTTWCAELVLLRFLEAADTERRLSFSFGPRGGGAAWPVALMEAGIEPEAERDPTRWAPTFRRRRVASAGAITRMEQVLDWTVGVLVKSEPDEAKAVWAFVKGRVFGPSVQERLMDAGFSRRTGYRRLEQGIRRVTTSLQASRADLLLPDLAHLAHIGLLPRSTTSSSDGVAPKRYWRAAGAVPSNGTVQGIIPRPERSPRSRGRVEAPPSS